MFLLPVIILSLLLPASSEAAYKIYLKNGSVISGVSSYDKKGDELIIRFGGGTMGIPGNEVIRIEETDAPALDLRTKERTGKQEEPPNPPAGPVDDKISKIKSLRAELESINSDLAALDEDEARLNKLIDAKKGKRAMYTRHQLKKIEEDLKPLQEELYEIRQQKSELLQRKSRTEAELRKFQ